MLIAPGYPKWDGKMSDRRQNIRHCENDERRRHQELIRDRIDDGPELGLLIEFPRKKTVDAIRDTRDNKHDQRPLTVSVVKQTREDGNERHPEEGEEIGDGQDRHAYLRLSICDLRLVDWSALHSFTKSLNPPRDRKSQFENRKSCRPKLKQTYLRRTLISDRKHDRADAAGDVDLRIFASMESA